MNTTKNKVESYKNSQPQVRKRRNSTKRKRKLKLKPKAFKTALVILLLILTSVTLVANLPKFIYPIEYFSIINKESKKEFIDPYFVCAVIKAESGFNEDAISPVGAIGLMQIMPETGEWIAEKNDINFEVWDLQEPQFNIQIGVQYLDFLLDYWEQDLPKTIASYNAGQNKVAEWIEKEIWDGTKENISDIPYEETRNYVEKVLKYYDGYLELYK